MIGFWDKFDVRIRIRVTILFVDRFYVWLSMQILYGSNCCRSKCHGTALTSFNKIVHDLPVTLTCMSGLSDVYFFLKMCAVLINIL